MTTFQAVIYAILAAAFEFIPVPPVALQHFLAGALGWQAPLVPLRGAIYTGLFLALLVSFRHDILSLISSFLQVVLLRRKPKAIDEKMPFLILLALVLPTLLFFFARDLIESYTLSPVAYLAIFAVAGFLPWFAESRSKRNKNHYDWNAIDAIFLGLGSALFLVPAIGRTTGAYFVATTQHYSKVGATKFILFVATPMIGAAAYWHLSGINFNSLAPLDDMSWLSFYVAGVVAFLGGLFSIHSVQTQMVHGSLRRYAFMRVAIVVIFLGVLYFGGNLSTYLEG